MIYNISFLKGKEKIEEAFTARTMKQAVEMCVQKHGQIRHISCKITGGRGVQRFCDTCLKNEGLYGYKDKSMKCKECNKDA
jgi:hypothetical protein